MKELFKTTIFRKNTQIVISQANEIIEEYSAEGYSLTVRQLYYQFVAKALIENTEKSYKRIICIVNNARLSGLIDWDAIEDRTRNLVTQSHWNSPSEIIGACVNQFRLDKWENQETYCEVWIEKDALIGVIERPCLRWDVPYFACKGNNSQSEQYKAGKRIAQKLAEGKDVHIFHLGDHDPKGLDMTRDNRDRLSRFAGQPVNLRRIALNMDQIEEFQPPPNFAKETDSLFKSYKKKYGNECWELDALQPSFIESLVEENITGLLDMDQWEETVGREEKMKNQIRKISETKRKG